MTILNTFPTEIVIITLAVIVIKESFESGEGLGLLFGIALIVLAVVILFMLILPHEITTTINTYEVTMDETVSFNEVMNKYNFIEKRGDIYVLQDKLPEGENE